MEIESDDIAHLLNEKGIVRQLEVSLAVRLEPEGLPDAVHRGLRQACLARDLADAPMRAVLRSSLQGPGHQLGHALIANRARTSGAQFVVQSHHAVLYKPTTPLAHGGVRHSQAPGDLLVRHSLRAEQNDSRPVNQAGGQRTGGGQSFQLFSVRCAHQQFRFRSSHSHRHLHCAPEMPIFRAILMPLIHGTRH
jgi:hypothetical protein